MTQSSAEASMLARGVGFDAIGTELLRALDACRPQCLSLHDATGEVLWLNAGVVGPDEHNYVLEALDELSLERKRTHMQRRLADNRRALFMGARDPNGNCCGLVFVIIDSPGGPEDHQPMPSDLAALMRRLSMQLAPGAAKAGAMAPLAVNSHIATIPAAAEVEVTELELAPDDLPLGASAASGETHERIAEPAPERVELRELSLQAPASVPESEAVTMLAPAMSLAPSPALVQSTGESLPIRARKFVRLQGRGANRRYQVTVLTPGEGQDIRVLKAVGAWLSHHLEQYIEEHASFAVPISAAAALDGRFVSALGGALAHRSLPEGMLGLLLPGIAWRHPGCAPLLAQCDRLRCPVTLDDFNLRQDGFQILRNKAIRMVKLDPQLTGPAMNDRFARASLAAITQSARVLGLHCVAKGDISSAGARWLAAAGIDYADPATTSQAGAKVPKGVSARRQGQAT